MPARISASTRLVLLLALLVSPSGCATTQSTDAPHEHHSSTPSSNLAPEESTVNTTALFLTIDGHPLDVTWQNSATVSQLAQLSESQALSLNAQPYGGFELVSELPTKITRSDRPYRATRGDILLYQGNTLVVMLGQNSWEYTPLGRITTSSLPDLDSITPHTSHVLTLSHSTPLPRKDG
ncbi:cyclophilin-like fold protein [Trueperella sp. LYQ141]|uniref:cyclophilin-like fold protein n=1 Tax=Trueperella sp. LYQ141 TaxID=3391058 RepID=UPI0039831A09